METKDSSPIQDMHTQSGAHPASYSIGPGAPCANTKAAGAWGWLLTSI